MCNGRKVECHLLMVTDVTTLSETYNVRMENGTHNEQTLFIRKEQQHQPATHPPAASGDKHREFKISPISLPNGSWKNETVCARNFLVAHFIIFCTTLSRYHLFIIIAWKSILILSVGTLRSMQLQK